MRYHFRFSKEKSGFWAQCAELKGCHTQAETLDSLKIAAEEALNLFLDEPEASTLTFPEPKPHPKSKNLFEVQVNPKIALALAIKKERQKQGLTQADAAKKMGIKNLFSYQRLESSKNSNPELMTLLKIKKAFPKIAIDQVLA